jgi:hypothetical protein
MAPSKRQPAKPLTDAEKARIRQMHADGATRNAIRDALGRSSGAITNFCQREGLTFPHPQKEQAVHARELSVRERTVAAHERQLEILELWQTKMLGGLKGQGWDTKLKGAGGSEQTARLEFLPPDDFKNAQTALTSATSAIKNLTPAGDAEKEEALSVVEQLAASLGLPPEAP